MAKKIICKNSLDEEMEFQYAMPFWLTGIEGLHKVEGTVSTVQSAFGVGEAYTGTTVKKRNIIIKGDIFDNFKSRREQLERVFILKDLGTFYYYEDDIERKINYYVESLEISENGNPRTFNISLICDNPYFSDLEEIFLSISQWEPKFEFPFSCPASGIEFSVKNQDELIYINNDTSIDYGLTIVIELSGTVKNINIINIVSRDELGIDGTFNGGDRITITTHLNNKKITLLRSGVETTITNQLKFGTKFIQAPAKTNSAYRVSAGTGQDYLETTIFYNQYYEAV